MGGSGYAKYRKSNSQNKRVPCTIYIMGPSLTMYADSAQNPKRHDDGMWQVLWQSVATMRRFGGPDMTSSYTDNNDYRTLYLSVLSLNPCRDFPCCTLKHATITSYILPNLSFISYHSPVCETWSFTLWEEYRLKLFENRVLRKIRGCIQKFPV
jgi:hypothetical protein